MIGGPSPGLLLAIIVLWLAGGGCAGAETLSVNTARDVTSRLERLGCPYQDSFRDGERLYARNTWDMQSFQGSLFIGAGNSSNIGPAPNAGPVPIIRFDPATQAFAREGQVDDEQIDVFQIHDGTLNIPGHDPRQNWDWGNFYRRGENGVWKKYRTIPGGLHTYGLAWDQGRLLGAIGIRGGAAVALSEDQGDSWTVVAIGRSRAYGFLTVGNTLYATKQFPASAEWHRLPAEKRKQHAAVYEFIAPNRFEARDDISLETLFPGVALPFALPAKVARPLAIGEKAIYLGAHPHNDHQLLPFGLFVASSLARGRPRVEQVLLPAGETPWDLLRHEGYLYVLTGKRDGGAMRVKVLRAPVQDLANLREVLHFNAATFARSFEILGNDFYFGLGCEVENPKQWRQEELSPETGQILRVKGGGFL